MKKRIKTLVALGLAMAMVVGCGNTVQEEEQSSDVSVSESTSESATDNSVEEESPYPDYLNLDGYRPIVKEGEEITITMAVKRSGVAESMPEDTWLFKFIEEKFNINLEVEWLKDTERKSIILASGDLPDMMIDIGIGSTDILNYGVRDGMFLDLNKYASEELTPNYCAMVEEYAAYMDYYTSSNGAVYAVPNFNNVGREAAGDLLPIYRTWYSKKYMDATGWEKVPETLDEFLEFCRDVKALDPETMGVEEIWPVADMYDYIWAYIQTAFGWVTDNWASYVSALWDADQGKVVIPCMDEKFEHFVEVFNIMYTEGLIHPDFLTLDDATSKAMMTAGQVAVCNTSNSAVYNYAGGTEDDWYSAVPLTSEWNKEPVACSGGVCTGAYTFVSADTEYPEVCMRLIDWMVSPEGRAYRNYGAPSGSEDTLGMYKGFEVKDDGYTIVFPEVVSGEYKDNTDYRFNLLSFIGTTVATLDKGELYAREMLGQENPQYAPPAKQNLDLANATEGKLMQPIGSILLDDTTRAAYSDLRSAVNAYVKAEVAKFMVGQRDLSEFDAFQEEILKAGGNGYSAIVMEYYKDQEEPFRP